MMMFATLNLALRIPSRMRIEEQFARRNLEDRFEHFVLVRPQFLLATATLRTASMFTLILLALWEAGVLHEPDRVYESVAASAVAMTLVLVFAVAIPNAWAKYAGEPLIVRLLPVLAASRWICYPIIAFLGLFDPLVRRLAGVPVRDQESYADELEREILTVVSEGERHGAVDEEEKEMIESVFELSETRVDEIMTPRTEMAAVPKDAGWDMVLETIRNKGHSRIPVYDGTIDTILGILYAKDLLFRDDTEPFDVTRQMRRALFVPESKSVRDLLREFQTQKVHIAVVLDEYGGTAGLVTIEDILEEVVGEIADEYDPTHPVEVKRIDERTFEVDARMRIDDLNHQLDLELPDDGDYETIGGFVFSKMGRIPRVGESIQHDNISIQIVGAEPRRVTRVRLIVIETEANERVTA
jgi:CBS domain containing-hemolysin-like protein